MQLSGNTILITGGATGIGFALAKEFSDAGNEVIICGRREEKLKEAKGLVPKLHTKRCDISNNADREELFTWVSHHFPSLNILVNNAGIQRMIDFRKGDADLLSGEDEIDINLKGTLYLTAKFIPLLSKNKNASIVNVSSGLGFIPIAFMPIYCATKAAIHSLSISLRHQLKTIPIAVFELIPPTVDTDLDKGARKRRGQKDLGIKPEELAKGFMPAFLENKFEFAYGQSEHLRKASRENPEEQFNRMNSW